MMRLDPADIHMVNAYDENGDAVGSAIFWPLYNPEFLAMIPEPQTQPVMWVEWIYARPGAGNEVFQQLALYIKAEADRLGLPIQAYFRNERLKAVMDRYFQRAASSSDEWADISADAYKLRRPFIIDFDDIDHPDPPIWIGKPGQYHDESPMYRSGMHDYYGEIWDHVSPPLIRSVSAPNDVYDDLAKAHIERVIHQQEGLKERTSSASVYYHHAPVHAREDILKNGIDYRRVLATAHPNVDAPDASEWVVDHPGGNYLSENPRDHSAGATTDMWAVNPQGLKIEEDLNGEPGDGWFVSYDPIPASNISLVEEGVSPCECSHCAGWCPCPERLYDTYPEETDKWFPHIASDGADYLTQGMDGWWGGEAPGGGLFKVEVPGEAPGMPRDMETGAIKNPCWCDVGPTMPHEWSGVCENGRRPTMEHEAGEVVPFGPKPGTRMLRNQTVYKIVSNDGNEIQYRTDEMSGSLFTMPVSQFIQEQRSGNIKTAMAERSGDPELDALIEEFLSFEGQLNHDWVRADDLSDMRDSESASGMCDVISKDFVDFCNSRGLPAWMSDDYFNDVGHKYRSDWRMLHPEQFGYEYQKQDWHTDEDEFGWLMSQHCVVVVEDSRNPDVVYMVDWTGAQYGSPEFPTVKRLDEQGQWQRKWATDMIPSGQIHIMPDAGHDDWSEGQWDTDTFLDHRMINRQLQEQSQADQYKEFLERERRRQDAQWPEIGIKEAHDDETWAEFDKTDPSPTDRFMRQLEAMPGVQRIRPIPNTEIIFKPGDVVQMEHDRGSIGTVLRHYPPGSARTPDYLSYLGVEPGVEPYGTATTGHTYDVKWHVPEELRSLYPDWDNRIGPMIEGERLWPEGDVRLHMALSKTAADNVPGMPVSDSGHWVYLDGRVGFDGSHSEITERLARELGYDETKVKYLSNWVARGHCPPDHAIAVGTLKNGYPYIHGSTRDRNAVWDAVKRHFDEMPQYARIAAMHRQPGDRCLFEYHCWESHDSADAQAWYRSHQPVTILRQLGPDEVDDEVGDMFRVRWDDGYEHDVFDDELVDSPNEFYRPNPDLPSPKRSGASL